MALNHSFGDATLTREAVLWPGSADAVRARFTDLRNEWVAAIERLTDDDLRSPANCRWPMQDRPFSDIVGWLNVELMKNAAEIGYARFLYAVRT